MTGSPEVSAVVVAWRAREDVLGCLESLALHAGLSHEAIVVDDGSGDGTPEAVRDAFPEARVVVQERNGGLPRGRNAALPLVRGRYVLMLDADTRVRSGALPALVETLEGPGVGLVGPKLLNEDGSLQLSCFRFPPFFAPLVRRGPIARLMPDPRLHRVHLMKDWAHDRERPVVWVAGAAQMYRADLPRLIGPYDERVSSYGGEDLDWCLRVWHAGLEVRYVPQAEIVHRFQRVTRRQEFGRKALRTLWDWYYLQAKHARLRRDPALAEARA